MCYSLFALVAAMMLLSAQASPALVDPEPLESKDLNVSVYTGGVQGRSQGGGLGV
jgi:hypothetical protein